MRFGGHSRFRELVDFYYHMKIFDHFGRSSESFLNQRRWLGILEGDLAAIFMPPRQVEERGWRILPLVELLQGLPE